jgi:hypothetical protein
MRKKIEWLWERLDKDTYRAKVIGGWIVKSGWTPEEREVDLSMIFVPDRDHEWVIVQIIKPEESAPSKLAKDFMASSPAKKKSVI